MFSTKRRKQQKLEKCDIAHRHLGNMVGNTTYL